jgi:hypothetical protein
MSNKHFVHGIFSESGIIGKRMAWTIGEVRQRLGPRLIGKLKMRELVCKTIILLPEKLRITVCDTVWFISSQDDAWAFTFRGSDIKEAHLIFLSDELLKADDEQIIYTILHEIGHVLSNHRNSLGGYIQTESEIHQQEDEADRFARKYISGKG